MRCLFFTELLGDSNWTATYTLSNVCALRGSRANFSFNYDYPYHKIDDCYATHLETLVFTKEGRKQSVNIGNDTDYAGRVEYRCEDKRHTRARCYGICDMTIKDVRLSDSAEYTFRKPKHPDFGYTINHGVILSVFSGKLDNNILLMWPEWELVIT